MRTLPGFPIVATLTLLCAGVVEPAMGQVTTNQGALDALGSGHPAQHATASHHASRPTHAASHATAKPSAHTSHKTAAKPPGAHSPAATIPAGPPPPPVFKAPVINVPLHPPPPPPPVPVVQDAAGAATAIDNGTRITFGGGSADLNPATMQALQTFATRLKADPQSRADLDAYGAGTADDPSTPRRLALSRGLASRAVLINEGIPSTRIYVRVIGQPTGATKSADAAAPSDRVDMRLSQSPGAAPAPAPANAPADAASPAPAAAPAVSGATGQ